jgi:hypothetical protein
MQPPILNGEPVNGLANGLRSRLLRTQTCSGQAGHQGRISLELVMDLLAAGYTTEQVLSSTIT